MIVRSNGSGLGQPHFVPALGSLLAGVLLASSSFGLGRTANGSPRPADDPSDESLVEAAWKECDKSNKKLEAFVGAVDKAVQEALRVATWRSGSGDGVERPLGSHPFFGLVDSLSAAARAEAGRKEISKETRVLLAQYPWSSQLELSLGLAYGSDREVPPHENGFIDLGAIPTPPPSFPDLSTNRYLFGLREIVGWQYHVRPGKKPTFTGRKPTDPAAMESVLPPRDRLRSYLQGSTPEVSLFAIPELTHRIHSRLVERRRSATGEASRMDRFLAFLDSKWNGFLFEIPDEKNRMAIVLPAHALFTDHAGFIY